MLRSLKSGLVVFVAAQCVSLSGLGCGLVRIAEMSWPSAQLLAHIDQLILSKGFGCDAQIVPGDTVPTFTSMVEKNRPEIPSSILINFESA